MQHKSAHLSTLSSYHRLFATDVLISPAGRPDVLFGEDDFTEVIGPINWYFLVKFRCISDLICWWGSQVETASYLQLTQSDAANMTENSSSFQIFTVYSAKSSSFQDPDHNSPIFQTLTYSLYLLNNYFMSQLSVSIALYFNFTCKIYSGDELMLMLFPLPVLSIAYFN